MTTSGTIRGAVSGGAADIQLGAGTWVDTGSRFASAPTFGATGWSFSLTGGWSATDPFDGPYLIYPALSFVAGQAWAAFIEIIERVAPGLSSDVYVIAGWCNEDVDSGTIDGCGWGINYTAAARMGRRLQVVNGTATISNGTADAGNGRIVQGGVQKLGTGATARWQGLQGRLLDAAGAPISASSTGASDLGAAGGDIAPRPFIAVQRTAATAGTENFTMDFRRGNILGVVNAT